jgi:hypothetical protein
MTPQTGHFRPNPEGRGVFGPDTSSLLLPDSDDLNRVVVAPRLRPKAPASRPRYHLR